MPRSLKSLKRSCVIQERKYVLINFSLDKLRLSELETTAAESGI